MTYATLMVHLELGHSNQGLLEIAGSLARQFEAGVIGIAACQPVQVIYGDGYVCVEPVRQDFDELAHAEAEFREILRTRAAFLEWRSTVMFAPLPDYLAREARSADLVVTAASSGALLDVSRRVNAGDLLMQVGRPVLIIPPAADNLKLDRVLVGWKDTRPTRRVIVDALPLLKKAAQVLIVEITTADELVTASKHLDEVAGWLGRHGVSASQVTILSTGDDAAQLNAIACEQRIDIIVAGAYGHGRVREWMLGGVTRDLLLRAEHCSLVSH